MPWLALAGVASAGIGAAASSAASSKAQAAEQQAYQQYLNIAIPDPAEQQLALQQYKQTGKMDPRMQQAVQQSQSQMAKIQTDPALKSAQMTALNSLQDEAANGGHTLAQDAYLNKAQSDVAADNRGRIGAIQSSFAQRGMGQPGGLELQAQLANAQNETQRANTSSMNATAQAQQNALQALQMSGTQAGQMRNQDFQQQASVAQAQDDINRFNTAALNSTNAANTQASNSAQAYNLQNTQNIANQNTNLGNQQQIYNKGLQQQQFQNQMGVASGAANALNGVANQYNNQATIASNTGSQIGQGLVKMGVAAYNKPKDPNDNNNSEDEGSY